MKWYHLAGIAVGSIVVVAGVAKLASSMASTRAPDRELPPPPREEARETGNVGERVASGLIGLAREGLRVGADKVRRDDEARERRVEREARSRSEVKTGGDEEEGYDPIAAYHAKNRDE